MDTKFDERGYICSRLNDLREDDELPLKREIAAKVLKLHGRKYLVESINRISIDLEALPDSTIRIIYERVKKNMDRV
jgi:hypothetical protein